MPPAVWLESVVKQSLWQISRQTIHSFSAEKNLTFLAQVKKSLLFSQHSNIFKILQLRRLLSGNLCFCFLKNVFTDPLGTVHFQDTIKMGTRNLFPIICEENEGMGTLLLLSFFNLSVCLSHAVFLHGCNYILYFNCGCLFASLQREHLGMYNTHERPMVSSMLVADSKASGMHIWHSGNKALFLFFATMSWRCWEIFLRCIKISLMTEASSSRKKNLCLQKSIGLTETSHGNLHFSSTTEIIGQWLGTARLAKVLDQAE